ncbi:unnamed protein product [Cuscuta epithymum]|uniref:Uncharacterized protein n=1 Tax=Cuscuta epithymum TaxID=186058 RepID=A0AAV0EJR1_9ASTE|nr:unnamed protein product [Cuscuta epithymum]CAH9122838.1 unnamed protein product [Cuscuta epithymum]
MDQENEASHEVFAHDKRSGSSIIAALENRDAKRRSIGLAEDSSTLLAESPGVTKLDPPPTCVLNLSKSLAPRIPQTKQQLKDMGSMLGCVDDDDHGLESFIYCISSVNDTKAAEDVLIAAGYGKGSKEYMSRYDSLMSFQQSYGYTVKRKNLDISAGVRLEALLDEDGDLAIGKVQKYRMG